MAESQLIAVDAVRTDGNTQARVGLHDPTIEDYRKVLREGGTLDEGDVFFDGEHYWSADIHHRLAAYKAEGCGLIRVKVHAGSRRDARLFAIGANARHGLRRTAADKELAVRMLLEDEEWGRNSVAWLKEMAGVSHCFADKVKRAFLAAKGQPPAETVTGKDGREYPAGGGHKPSPSRKKEPKPESEADDEAPAAGPQLHQSPARETESGPMLDAKGRPVPPHLVAVFQAAGEFRSIVQIIGQLKTRVGELKQKPGSDSLHAQSVIVELDDAQRTLRVAAPFVVCPDCGGAGCNKGKKSLCPQSGWLPEGRWVQLTAEQRAVCESFRGKKKAA